MTPDQIRATRQSLGLTRAEFARLIGVSTSYVEKLEIGAKTADRSTSKLLSVLSVPGVVERLSEAE